MSPKFLWSFALVLAFPGSALAEGQKLFLDLVTGKLLVPYCARTGLQEFTCKEGAFDFYVNVRDDSPRRTIYKRAPNEVRARIRESGQWKEGDQVLYWNSQKKEFQSREIELLFAGDSEESAYAHILLELGTPFRGPKIANVDVRLLKRQDDAKTGELRAREDLCVSDSGERVKVEHVFENGMAEVNLASIPLFENLQLMPLDKIGPCPKAEANVSEAVEPAYNTQSAL